MIHPPRLRDTAADVRASQGTLRTIAIRGEAPLFTPPPPSKIFTDCSILRRTPNKYAGDRRGTRLALLRARRFSASVRMIRRRQCVDLRDRRVRTSQRLVVRS